MKKLLQLLFIALISSPAFAQPELDSAWFRENYIKVEKMIPMRDGVKLFTSIYIPKDTTELHPILMTRTPYSSAPYGENYRGFWSNYQARYLRENYIMVYQDVRGRYMSEGNFVDIRPFNPEKKGKDIDEASDTYDTIDWLVKNIRGNNNRVGVFGISYPGFYSTMAALSGHPALKAVSPQAPVTEWFIGDDFHHNGAFFQMDAFAFYKGFGVPRPVPVQEYKGGYEFTSSDAYEFYLRTGTLKNLARIIGDSIAFWQDLYAHPDYDNWWKARNPRNFVAGMKPAMLVVGGLFDAEDCYGAWRLYEAIEEKNAANGYNKIVMGPWSHGQWSRSSGAPSLGNIEFGSRTGYWYQNNVEIPFFNYHLKGKGIDTLPEATIFITGKNEWKSYTKWPPAGSSEKAIYLQPGGGLSWTKPTVSKSATTYTSDPAHPVPYADGVKIERTTEYMNDDQRFASRRPDVITFQTQELTEDLTVTGTVIADLKVTLSTTDADFVVKVVDVYPENEQPNMQGYPMGGYQMLVRGEIMRGKYRNSFEKPSPFKPGAVEQVRFELPDIAHCFKKGHRVMIQIQSSWFPLADRNPQQFMNIYQAEEKDFVPSVIQVHHDVKNSSSIVLPVLDRP